MAELQGPRAPTPSSRSSWCQLYDETFTPFVLRIHEGGDFPCQLRLLLSIYYASPTPEIILPNTKRDFGFALQFLNPLKRTSFSYYKLLLPVSATKLIQHFVVFV